MKILDVYRREWPRVAAVQAMALGGTAVLVGRKSQNNLRALAVMNGMTMCAHQYEEYVDPGYLPGLVNAVLFKSDDPRKYPFSPTSAMCANVFFRALYVPPMLFPKIKWLGLAPALLGIGQGIAHATVMPVISKSKYPYSPGALTAALLHVPIGITYIGALHRQGPISRADWAKSAGALVAFLILGVATPNIALRGHKDSPYEFTEHQMGPFDPHADAAERAEADTPTAVTTAE